MASHGPRTPFDNPVVEWIDQRLPLFTMMQKEYGVFPTPRNFNYLWNFGAIATVMLVTMIVTGVVLAMHYTPHADMAFTSVERIMRDVNWGWMLRYLHMNGASFFFIAVYIHMWRGMYYGSYKKPRELLWILGVVIYLLMMATAFMGYTLPWSQMGGWAANVITSLFSAIPVVGDSLVSLLWGGFSVDNPTLNRFFALHFLLPFVIFAVVFLHIWALHVSGSGNPLGIDVKGPQDTLPFHPYYTIKDTFGLGVFLLAYVAISFYAPLLFSHPDHFVEYNAQQTPPHIVPEWYFLPFYAVLRAVTFDMNIYILAAVGLVGMAMWPLYSGKVKTRSDLDFKKLVLLFGAAGVLFALGLIPQYTPVKIPLSEKIIEAKLGGVLAMFGAVLILVFLPWLDKQPVRSARFRPLYFWALMGFGVTFLVLGYLGAQLPEGIYVILSQLFTGYYFAFFLILVPFISVIEKPKPLPGSIHEAVLAAKKV